MPTKPNKRGRIESLPEKEFRRMIVKMIQNLENKIELQINSLETRIEKSLQGTQRNKKEPQISSLH